MHAINFIVLFPKENSFTVSKYENTILNHVELTRLFHRKEHDYSIKINIFVSLSLHPLYSSFPHIFFSSNSNLVPPPKLSPIFP